MWIEVLVRLIVPDPWSFTVFDTLRRKFGLTEIVDVRRLRGWDIQVETDDEDEARSTVESIMAETALLANPNRDRYFVRSRPGPIPMDFLKVDEKGQVFVIKVIDIDDIIGRSKQNIVRERLGIKTIKRITYSTIWLLEIAGDSDMAQGLASEVAVAREWRKGLLANPHSQRAEVARLSDYLGRMPQGGS